jgi:hypothetical protein
MLVAEVGLTIRAWGLKGPKLHQHAANAAGPPQTPQTTIPILAYPSPLDDLHLPRWLARHISQSAAAGQLTPSSNLCQSVAVRSGAMRLLCLEDAAAVILPLGCRRRRPPCAALLCQGVYRTLGLGLVGRQVKTTGWGGYGAGQGAGDQLGVWPVATLCAGK